MGVRDDMYKMEVSEKEVLMDGGEQVETSRIVEVREDDN